MKIFKFLRDDDKEPRIGGSEKSERTELNIDRRDSGDRIEKGSFGQLNESRLPDFEHTPPAPSTPPPPAVDRAGSEGAE
jgi:hypothetical protein